MQELQWSDLPAKAAPTYRMVARDRPPALAGDRMRQPIASAHGGRTTLPGAATCQWASTIRMEKMKEVKRPPL
ncbi:hypothetical protein GW17_00026453 [Ensete ventricosum]|nr:hypothetical protein GW17_00026453 [Ensete ventricosum]